MKLYTTQSGFALPTLLIVSTVLMVISVTVLQGTVTVRNSILTQQYQQLAREAAEAGLRYAQACLAKGGTWTSLNPRRTCTNVTNFSQPYAVLDTGEYFARETTDGPHINTRFEVGPPDERDDGSRMLTSVGQTRVNGQLRASETLSEATGLTSTGVLPHMLSVSTGTGTGAYTHMLGYDKLPYSTGANSVGQLGDSTSTNRNRLVSFILPQGIHAQKIVGSGVNTFVLGSNFRVYGAGNNNNGQLGDGTTNNTSARAPVEFGVASSILAKDVIAKDSGSGYTTYILATNGRVYGAGVNNQQQIANTTVEQYNTPQLINAPGSRRVMKMAATRTSDNNDSLVIITEDGNVYGRGANTNRQLGGTTSPLTAYTQMALPAGVAGIDAQVGYYNTYILGSDGNVYGFGRNSAGQLGNGNVTTPQNTAQRFQLASGLTALSMTIAGSSSTAETDSNSQNTAYVLASDHQVYAAGQNHKGQIGDGTTTNRNTPRRFVLPSGMTAQKVVALYFTACVLTSTKDVYCSGDNKYGQLGLGNTTDRSTPQRFPLPSGVQALDVKVSYDSVHVIASDGNIYAAGRNTNGQLGDGTNTQRNSPVIVQRPVREIHRTVYDAAMWHVHTSILASDGSVWGTGWNEEGQLGNGATAVQQRTPVRFQLPTGYARELSGGVFNTFVLSSDSQLYGAGRNHRGQLGIASTQSQSTPVQYQLNNANMPSGLTVRQVSNASTGLGGPGGTSAGNESTFILASNNRVYGTGYNQYGQLGNGTTTQLTVPRSDRAFRIPTTATALNVRFGDGADVARTFVQASNGEWYAAGSNIIGELGINSTAQNHTCPSTPCPIVPRPSSTVHYTDVSLGGWYSTYFLGSNGRPYATGYNFFGQLGDGSTTTRRAPVEMTLPSGLRALRIEAGVGSLNGSVYVLASDGQLYAAGRNIHGQLGRGIANDHAYPTLERVELPSGLSVVDFWAGQENVLILASDGQVYGSGRNDVGQLGTGDTANKTRPTQRFLLPSGVRAQTVVTQFASRNNNDRWYFTGVLGSDNILYVAGNNFFGQLGGDSAANVVNPRPYEVPQPVTERRVIF